MARSPWPATAPYQTIDNPDEPRPPSHLPDRRPPQRATTNILRQNFPNSGNPRSGPIPYRAPERRRGDSVKSIWRWFKACIGVSPSLGRHPLPALSTSRCQNRKALVIIDHPTIATLATARSPITGAHRGGPHTGWRERPTISVSLPATPSAGAQNHATLIHSKRATSPPANSTTSQHPPPGQGPARHERTPQSSPPGTLEPGPPTSSASTTIDIRTQHTPAYAAALGVPSQSVPPAP